MDRLTEAQLVRLERWVNEDRRGFRRNVATLISEVRALRVNKTVKADIAAAALRASEHVDGPARAALVALCRELGK